MIRRPSERYFVSTTARSDRTPKSLTERPSDRLVGRLTTYTVENVDTSRQLRSSKRLSLFDRRRMHLHTYTPTTPPPPRRQVSHVAPPTSARFAFDTLRKSRLLDPRRSEYFFSELRSSHTDRTRKHTLTHISNTQTLSHAETDSHHRFRSIHMHLHHVYNNPPSNSRSTTTSTYTTSTTDLVATAARRTYT